MVHPPSLAWFKREYITKSLALTMLAMGTTLSPQASEPIQSLQELAPPCCEQCVQISTHNVLPKMNVLSCRTLWRS